MITGIDWMKMYVLFKFGYAAACNFDGRLIAMGEDGEAEERRRAHTRGQPAAVGRLGASSWRRGGCVVDEHNTEFWLEFRWSCFCPVFLWAEQ